MRYFVITAITIVLLCGFSVRSSHAGFFNCSATILNCLPDDFTWCSYQGDSVWDTMYSYNSGTIGSGDSGSPGCASIEDLSECYVVGDEAEIDISCVTYDVDGFVDCNEYSCVDGDVSWHSGSSEYCCNDNTCVTDCD